MPEAPFKPRERKFRLPFPIESAEARRQVTDNYKKAIDESDWDLLDDVFTAGPDHRPDYKALASENAAKYFPSKAVDMLVSELGRNNEAAATIGLLNLEGITAASPAAIHAGAIDKLLSYLHPHVDVHDRTRQWTAELLAKIVAHKKEVPSEDMLIGRAAQNITHRHSGTSIAAMNLLITAAKHSKSPEKYSRYIDQLESAITEKKESVGMVLANLKDFADNGPEGQLKEKVRQLHEKARRLFEESRRR
jgi:rubrerythrin